MLSDPSNLLPSNPLGALNPRYKYRPPEGYQRWQLTVAWDGAPYAGWQIQPQQPSVQGELLGAMQRLSPSKEATTEADKGGRGSKPVVFAPVAAGRTDTGVHAQAMPIHWDVPLGFSLPCERLPRALQAFLPHSISVFEAAPAPEGFHARFSCHERRYIYRIRVARQSHPLLHGRVLHWPYGELDQQAMQDAAVRLIGLHDFAAFATQEDRQTQRELYDLSVKDGAIYGEALLEIHVSGESFLRHMVRGLVGTLLQVGQHKLSPCDIEGIVQSKQRSKAGMNVPAQGLYFAGATYAPL